MLQIRDIPYLGSYPTPKGLIKVRHERQSDGTLKSAITLPPGVERVSLDSNRGEPGHRD